MGKIENGINGGFSGKVGPVIGASWKGINYMRGLSKRKKKKKKTEKVKAVNTAFGFLNTFLTPFQVFIKIGFMHYAIKMTERNAAHAINYRNQVIGSYPDFEIDYSKLVLSMGDLPGISAPLLVLENDQINITWEPNKIGPAQADDQVMLCIYDKDQKMTDGFIGVVNRSNKMCSFTLKSEMMTSNLEVYLSLASWDRSLISDSQYLGAIVHT